MRTIILLKPGKKAAKICAFIFGQLHLLLIILALLLFGIENAEAQCTPSGDQNSYGSGSWIGYVYSNIDGNNPPTSAFVTYIGYVTQPEMFDQNLGSGAISGANVCGTYADRMAFRFKMQKTFISGYYTFTIGGDDGVRLSLDGGSTFVMSDWNYHAYQATTATFYLSGPLNLVLENYDQGGESRVTFSYTSCTSYSTAPTSISGAAAICNGSSTTLTATGGTEATGCTYQWGAGSTIGSNAISGQTGASITVSPTANTTYWVRRIDASPCSNITSGITQAVAVTTPSTAPTAITGTTTLCLGSSTVLTATGGTLATGSVYEWGKGSVGSNIISGQTAASITVTPTATTTYWVRRTNASPCSTTGAATVSVTVNVPAGNQTSYGSNSWIGYVYSDVDSANPPTNVFTTNYRGYITQTETFDQSLGSGSISGANLCGSYTDRFSIRFKMQKNFTSGYYTFTAGGDDGYRLSLDGGATFAVTNFTDHGYTTSTSIQYYLSGNVNLILEYYEQGGDSRVSFSYTACTNFSSAPTGISGTTPLCSGTGGTTLAATGGFEAPGATYQWGTGSTVGSNIIGGANSSTYYINPSATTTYWVRRVDGTPCNLTTGGAVQTIIVASPSTNPTGVSTTASNICSGTSITLTANGGTLAPGGSYQWGTGYTAGSNIIPGENAATLTISPTVTSGYWVRRVDVAPCNTATPGVNTTITVYAASVTPTSISSVTTSCSGTSVQLTAVGGTLGTSGSYQWGTGSIIGSNVIGGNSVSNYVSPTTTTTYWVRIVDGWPCNSNTAGVTQTVTVSTASTAPSGIAASSTSICSGSSVTLTANGGTAGTACTYQWGTGSTVGSNIISGSGNSISASPTASTVYWVRRLDPAPCSTQTGGPTISITVATPSTAPTAITGGSSSFCSGTSYTLTATGGTAASGSTYQWGTGSVIGSNAIAGTGASITVTPTATTTYWVRRYDGLPCSAYTGGVTTTVTISAPPGNPATFGSNVWNVYGYNNPDITLATTVYAGYYSVSTLGVDTQNGTNSWNLYESPSNSAGWSGCSVMYDNFTITLKRQGFPCGIYNVVISNWDDVAQVYINGTQVWSCAVWYGGGGGCNGSIGSYTLDATSTIEIRIRENSGGAGVALALTKTNVDSTAPTSISGMTTTCNGSPVTLTASGGTLATTGSYQWGTGSTVGSNIIAGETAASITITPTTATTYWVRRYDSLCGATTAGITQNVIVTTGTTAGTLSTPNTTICRNNRPNPITLSGNVGNVIKWQYANDAAFTSGVTDITSTATVLSSADMGSLTATRYYRAVVQYMGCTVKYTPSIEILVPAAITYNGTWSGTPTASSSVIILNDLTLTSNLNVCSLQVNSGVILNVNPGSNLIVQTSVTVDPTASIIIKNNGSLVQVDDSSTDVGKITVLRNTARMKLYDYTYWSSPVQGWKLNDLSPNTLSDKYFGFNPVINNWVGIPSGNAFMDPAKGYIIRAPQGWSATNATSGIYEGTFTGIPNTGVVPVTIQKGTGALNLIGNPYPSAIDIDLFLTDPANLGIVNGTIYLWTHNTAISSTIPGNNTYNYTADDYAKYNLTGGIQTASAAITGGVAPDGKVASGQGFFIEAATGLASGTYTANFKNSMRVAGSNNHFFRVSQPAATTTTVEKNRIWLNLSNTQGGYNEILVGYVTGATNSFDNLFDGKVLTTGNVLSLYSIDEADNYSIQGRALPFTDTDIVPLGYKTTISGDFTIALGNFDGLFQNQDVYLVDKFTNTTQNLKNGTYTFATEIGTFNERFEIHYTSNLLAVNNPIAEANGVVIYTKGKQVNVNSARNITSVTVYDLLGRIIYTEDKINARDFKTPALNATNQVLIVKAILDNDTETTKKIVLN